jgi:hypothetical protein
MLGFDLRVLLCTNVEPQLIGFWNTLLSAEKQTFTAQKFLNAASSEGIGFISAKLYIFHKVGSIKLQLVGGTCEVVMYDSRLNCYMC